MTDYPRTEFARLLKELRQQAGLTQQELSERTGVSVREISKLENLTTPVTVRHAVATLLADGLGRTGPERDRFMNAARQRPHSAAFASAASGSPPPGPAVPCPPPALQEGPRLPHAVPQQLPADLPVFTGRIAEIDRLTALLDQPGEPGRRPVPVVISALAGTAGVGKTTLAVHWAHQIASRFPDGQLYVNLHGFDPGEPADPGEVLARFLRALGVPDKDIERDLGARAAQFRTRIKPLRLLVVLDNAAQEEQVRPLLPGSPSVAVIVTSRKALPGLAGHIHRVSLDVLPDDDAVALLRTMIGPRVDEEPQHAQLLARQCARLPLALRVVAEVAVTLPGMPLAQLTRDLDDLSERLRWLDDGDDPRSAVSTVFSWSLQHLTPPAAQLFGLLGLHGGHDWDTGAAAALAGVTSRQAARLLAALTRAHLIQHADRGRYGMHDLLRGYAASLAAKETAQYRRGALTRLFDYYLTAATAEVRTQVARWVALPAAGRPAVVQDWADDLAACDGIASTAAGMAGEQQDARAHGRHRHEDEFEDHSWLCAELANLAWVATQAAAHGKPAHAIGIAAAIEPYLALSSCSCTWEDTAPEEAQIYSLARDAAISCGDHRALIRALIKLGRVHARKDSLQLAAVHFRDAITLARRRGDRSGQAQAVALLGLAYYRQVRHRQAASCHRQALDLARETGDRYGEAMALNNFGCALTSRRRYDQAAVLYQAAMAISSGATNRGIARRNLHSNMPGPDSRLDWLQSARARREPREEAGCLVSVGAAYLRAGSVSMAMPYLLDGLALARALGEFGAQATALGHIGYAHAAQGRPAQAAACCREALAVDPPEWRERRTLVRACACNNIAAALGEQGLGGRVPDFCRHAVSEFTAIRGRAYSLLEYPEHEAVARANLRRARQPGARMRRLLAVDPESPPEVIDDALVFRPYERAAFVARRRRPPVAYIDHWPSGELIIGKPPAGFDPGLVRLGVLARQLGQPAWRYARLIAQAGAAEDRERLAGIEELARRAESSQFKVVISGSAGAGVTTLVSALLGPPVPPGFPAAAGKLITVIRYGAVPSVRHPGPQPAHPDSPPAAADRIPGSRAQAGRDGPGADQLPRDITAEVTWPCELCRHSIELIVLPGISDAHLASRPDFRRVWQDADTALVVLDARQAASMSHEEARRTLPPAPISEWIWAFNETSSTGDHRERDHLDAFDQYVGALTVWTDARSGLQAQAGHDQAALEASGIPQLTAALSQILTPGKGRAKILDPARRLRQSIRQARHDLAAEAEFLTATPAELAVIRQGLTELDHQAQSLASQVAGQLMQLTDQVTRAAREYFDRLPAERPELACLARHTPAHDPGPGNPSSASPDPAHVHLMAAALPQELLAELRSEIRDYLRYGCRDDLHQEVAGHLNEIRTTIRNDVQQFEQALTNCRPGARHTPGRRAPDDASTATAEAFPGTWPVDLTLLDGPYLVRGADRYDFTGQFWDDLHQLPDAITLNPPDQPFFPGRNTLKSKLASIAGTSLAEVASTYLAALRHCFTTNTATITRQHATAAAASFRADVTGRTGSRMRLLNRSGQIRASGAARVQARHAEIRQQLAELQLIDSSLDEVIDLAVTLEARSS